MRGRHLSHVSYLSVRISVPSSVKVRTSFSLREENCTQIDLDKVGLGWCLVHLNPEASILASDLASLLNLLALISSL